jgi:hypothetical protein
MTGPRYDYETSLAMAALHVGERKTLEDVAKHFGVSRERVRQRVRKIGVPEAVTKEIRLENCRGRVEVTCPTCGQKRVTQQSVVHRACSYECSVKRRSMSDEALLAELRRLEQEVGRTPSIHDMNDRGRYSHTTYVNRFGSWTAACEAAGLTPNRRGGAYDR